MKKNNTWFLNVKEYILYGMYIISLCSCGIFGPVKQANTQQYVIAYSVPTQTCSNINSYSVHVKTTTSNPPYDTNNMLYSESPYTLNQYAYSIWATLPENTISQAILQSIAGACLFGTVYDNSIQSVANYTITSQIIKLEEDISNNKSNVILSIKIQLINNNTHTIMNKTFTEITPIKPSPNNMASGISNNLKIFLNELTLWIGTQINR